MIFTLFGAPAFVTYVPGERPARFRLLDFVVAAN